MAALLTKSRYLTSLTCEKRMWLDTYGEAPTSSKPDRRAEEGKKFGAHARSLFPDGQLIDTLALDEAARITRQLIDSGATTLFEAAFVTDECAARIDILRRNEDAWDIIEVKASNSIKDHHLDDVAMQKIICEATGLNIARVFILHLNSQHRHPNVQALTICEDVTDLLAKHLNRAKSELPKAVEVLRSETRPKRDIGSQCKNDCPHYDGCFAEVPKYSVFALPSLFWKKKDDLIAQQILAVSELPVDYPLTHTQRVHATAMSTGSPLINRSSISAQLSKLQYPLYFLDFETINPAMPLYDGTYPYQQIPFQFSCHILEQNGELRHVEYLHLDLDDPRPALLAVLLKAIGTEGHIVAYHASFECERLNELSEAYPENVNALHKMISRAWDPELIFKNDYIHPDFLGRSSIKSVLPVLVPQLSYTELSHVHNGTEAQEVWWSVINDPLMADREAKISSLREYCKLDTLAMVEIHRVLCAL